jgi:hypothetical protein
MTNDQEHSGPKPTTDHPTPTADDDETQKKRPDESEAAEKATRESNDNPSN